MTALAAAPASTVDKEGEAPPGPPALTRGNAVVLDGLACPTLMAASEVEASDTRVVRALGVVETTEGWEPETVEACETAPTVGAGDVGVASRTRPVTFEPTCVNPELTGLKPLREAGVPTGSEGVVVEDVNLGEGWAMALVTEMGATGRERPTAVDDVANDPLGEGALTASA